MSFISNRTKIYIHMIEPELKALYNQPHRFYHNWSHIKNLLRIIQGVQFEFEDYELIKYAILFHDAVYNPKAEDNEYQSAKLFGKFNKEYNLFNKKQAELIGAAIIATKDHKNVNAISKVLNRVDTDILNARNLSELLEWEQGIFKEYQFTDIDTYIEKRCEFIKEHVCDAMSHHLISHIKSRHYKIGIYPGSFNPFHLGHLNVLEKAEKIFDKVIVVNGYNPEKVDLKGGNSHRVLPLSIQNRECICHPGLITEILKPPKFNVQYTIIRGLRNEYDLAYEENYRKWVNDVADSKIEFCYLFCDPELEHVSSSGIRQLRHFKISKYEVK